MSPGPAFSVNLYIMSLRVDYYNSELKLSLNTTMTKQQGFTWNPQVYKST